MYYGSVNAVHWGSDVGDTNGTTPVVMVTAPDNNYIRRVPQLVVYNKDKVSHTLYVRVRLHTGACHLWGDDIRAFEVWSWPYGEILLHSPTEWIEVYLDAAGTFFEDEWYAWWYEQQVT